MTALAEFAMLAHGWRRILMLVVAGALAGLSAPPAFFLVALFIAMPVLVWALDGAERQPSIRAAILGPAFQVGLAFGFGYFLVTLHWIGAAFLVDGEWLLVVVMPFAVAGLALILALFWGLGTALAHLFWSTGPARIFALATALTLAELARGYLFTGFPFDLLGYALTANLEMMQATSLIGVYGLTFVAVLISATPALVWPAAERSLMARTLPLFAAFGLLAAQIGWGNYRLAETQTEPFEDVVLRIVQPVIPQDIKWQTFAREETVTRLLDLSTMRTNAEDQGLDDVTHLIWPEAAIPFFLSDEPELLARIARTLPDDIWLLTGAPRQPYGANGEILPGAKPFNSVLAFNGAGEVVTSYDKTHLVPFGEYLPFGDFWSQFGITQFVEGSQGWAAGGERRLLQLPGSPAILPLVCYEIVFPGSLGDPVADAGFILVVTNDAWFDGSIGLAQHFHHARVRAVEEGKSVVRAANSGISAIVDPLGHIDVTLAEGMVGAIKGTPAQPLAPTVFARYRHWPLVAMLILGGLLALPGWRRRLRRLD
ncbi:apolipoprotein N-acyltransferase [Pelagibacterium halotolerans]|uniref:Apolipoprotein N-acyltransferase n=1 Tax=Pelagibacterium halotolerans (strain DSM 22347 / JCM 15775 / CGMCC 1.7692 / B2) TaxID=1082931 RepID=G4RA56_PELHB|nr:apolipoprotein N-acyltransferase [Pelagibacterium halotolerans]AEQ53539.1 Apolipoprotein N-acyltransferase / copper homeostasis protein CutE [Pelagibacterium halotolerans B2]QJR20283.1 apolipoprotein N-acyltransferase [Pelagibacterium halotolerans]SEA57953.1 Apolipoprotein N-acyltransferase [Pelagibacterium halotolerans]